MMQYREIFTYIDCAKGTLIDSAGAKITRDDYLPRLILSDEVMLYTSFVNVNNENGKITLEKKAFDNSMTFRIIGDADNDTGTGVMFASSYIPEKSNLQDGVIAFHIKSNSRRFADILKNNKSKKCEFVILGSSADPIATVVLGKDQFIAENRPCETEDFQELPPQEIITREELSLLLNLKSPIDHSHDEYASADHTHSMSDITDFNGSGGSITYSPGKGIYISENNEISIDYEEIAKKVHSHDEYAQKNHSHSEYAAANHDHSGYAEENHSHDEYAQKEHSHSGFAPEKHTHFMNDITDFNIGEVSSRGLNYIYFDVPDESQINAGDRLLLEIDFDNADDFSSKVSFSQADCQLFNPATGNWISIPQDGIDLAMASSKLRFPMPEISYSNCRYRWKVVDGTVGSYYTAII